MNIALLHYTVPPVVGGVESVIGQHARLMADAGHSVRLVAGRGEQLDPRIPLVHLPLADSRHPDVLAVKSRLDAGQVPPLFEQLVAEIRSSLGRILPEVDALIAHNVCSLHMNLALTAAVRTSMESGEIARLILWHHDLAWATPRYRSELHSGFPWDLIRSDWPRATHVVVSELRRRELAELTGVPVKKIAVIPGGVDAARFLKLEAQTLEFVNQLNLLTAEPLLLLPARITPRKNIELALLALARLRERFPRAAMVVTGPLGPHNPANREYFAKLKSLRTELDLERDVHFLAELTETYLPDEVIADFFRLADALLLPSQEEGFGMPVLEAGLARLPVFCSDIPPLRELGGGEAVYFAPDADPREVAERVSWRLASDLAFGLRARILKTYTWERVYAGLISPLLEP